MNANPTVLDLNQASNSRAESVPPNVVCTNNPQPFLPRAQSEQPNFFNYGATVTGTAAAAHPFRQCSNVTTNNNPSQSGLLYQRNLQNSRLLRHNQLLNTSRQITPTFYDTEHTSPSSFPNNYINAQNPDAPIVCSSHKDPNAAQCHQQAQPQQQTQQSHTQSLQHQQQTPAHQQQQQQQTQQPNAPILMHHNNNTSNNANINNLHQPNAVAAPNNANMINNSVSTANNNISRAFNSQMPALNNQVPPGNRANNYWDNFRR